MCIGRVGFLGMSGMSPNNVLICPLRFRSTRTLDLTSLLIIQNIKSDALGFN